MPALRPAEAEGKPPEEGGGVAKGVDDAPDPGGPTGASDVRGGKQILGQWAGGRGPGPFRRERGREMNHGVDPAAERSKPRQIGQLAGHDPVSLNAIGRDNFVTQSGQDGNGS